MVERAKDRDVVLGKTLAETAELNSPEYLAGIEASAAVQRATMIILLCRCSNVCFWG